MRYFTFFLLVFSFYLFSCDRNDEDFKTWEKSLSLDTGLGVIQKNSGEYLFHSHDQIVTFNENCDEIWRINLSEQLQDLSNLSISSIQTMESNQYAVLIQGSGISDDDSAPILSLLTMDENGMILTRPKIFSGNNVKGSSMKVLGTNFQVSIVKSRENNDDTLLTLNIDASGEVIEEKSYGLNNQNYAVSGSSLILNNDRGFLLEAISKSNTGEESTNRRLIKLDGDLHKSWSVDFGGPDFNEINDIVELSSGNFILAGTYLSQGWIIKIDSAGNLLWDKKYPDEEPGKQFFFDTAETTPGDIIRTGSNNVNGAGADDLWLVNLDETGEINWEVNHETPYYDFGRSVIFTLDRGYILAGGTQSSFESPIRMWLLKLNSDGKL